MSAGESKGSLTDASSNSHPSTKRGVLRSALPWALVVAWACFIFFMSAKTGSDLDQGAGLAALIKQHLAQIQLALFGPGVDLVSPAAHFCEYLVLGALLQNALGASRAACGAGGASAARGVRELRDARDAAEPVEGDTCDAAGNEQAEGGDAAGACALSGKGGAYDASGSSGAREACGTREPRIARSALVAVVLAVVLASAYGITDEIHQIFVPGRMCDPLDWAVDTAGAALGAVSWALLRSRFSRGTCY